MISLRYHIVSISAVFLSLAVGIVLGSATLSDALLSGLSNERGDLAKQVSDLQAERNVLNARLADADGFASAVGPLAVQGQLEGRTVFLVTTADAQQTDRDLVRNLVASAGGTVTGELQLTEAFVDPAKSDQLRDLVTRLLPAGVQLPTAADPGTLAGGLVGPLILNSKDTNQPQASPQEMAAALSGLTSGGFVQLTNDVRPAQLAIVLTGGSARAGAGSLAGAPPSRDVGDRAATVARFATQIDRAGAGVVLAGRAGSGDGTGAVGVVRADTVSATVLSTVDNVDTGAGRVATILALRDQLDGKSGGYGTAGNAQAVAPRGVPGR